MSNLIKEFKKEFENPKDKTDRIEVVEMKRDYLGYPQQKKEYKSISIKKISSLNIIGAGKPGSKFVVFPQKDDLEKHPDMILVYEEDGNGNLYKRMGLTIQSLEEFGLI